MIEEETEVKSKQELIEKWELAIEAADFYGKGKEDRLIEYMRDFLDDLNQLDEKGKQHANEKQSEETETVAGVFVDYLIASAKLKLALKMEVKEME